MPRLPPANSTPYSWYPDGYSAAHSEKLYGPRPPAREVGEVGTLLPRPSLNFAHRPTYALQIAHTRVERSTRHNETDDDVDSEAAIPKHRGGSRYGKKNFSDSDVNALLDSVASIEPLGMNEWALVTTN